MGLSISRSVLEIHKFLYEVKNNEDGATFWFELRIRINERKKANVFDLE